MAKQLGRTDTASLSNTHLKVCLSLVLQYVDQHVYHLTGLLNTQPNDSSRTHKVMPLRHVLLCLARLYICGHHCKLQSCLQISHAAHINPACHCLFPTLVSLVRICSSAAVQPTLSQQATPTSRHTLLLRQTPADLVSFDMSDSGSEASVITPGLSSNGFCCWTN